MQDKTINKSVFTVLVQDRHSDPDIEVYADKDEAIARARELAKEYCRFPEDYKEKKIADWTFYVEYSCENDCVTVLEREVL